MTRARLLLLSDGGLLDRDVAERQGISPATVASIRRKSTEGSLEAALYEKAQPKQPPKLNAQQTAILIAEVSPSPDGREEWTMQLLANHSAAWGLASYAVSDSLKRRTAG